MKWKPKLEDLLKVTSPGTAAIDALLPGGHKGALNTAMHGGKTGNPGDLAKDAGMSDYMQAIKDFEQNGNNQYNWLGDLASGPDLGPTEYGKIAVDPRYSKYEMDALSDLEQLSKDGLSIADQADLARLEGDVNRQNRGRLGAIQQNMASRGMSGSGLELVAQQQAAQDATERQALASLEKAGMAQAGRRAATQQLGQLSGQLSSRDFQQQAQKAQAQDAINRFNNANKQEIAQYNHQGRQGIANQNVGQNNQFQQNVLNAKQGGAQMQYNSGAEANNQAAMRRQQRQAENMGWVNTAFNGAKMAGQVMGMSDGGVVPGEAKHPGDHPANDTVPAMLSPGEVVIPRSVAQDPDHAGKAIESLLKAMQHMSKRGK